MTRFRRQLLSLILFFATFILGCCKEDVRPIAWFWSGMFWAYTHA